MNIDWTINVGTIVGALPWAIIGLWFVFGTRGKADTLGTDVSEIKTNFAKMQEKFGELASAVASIAVAEEKIAAVNKRLDDEKTEGVEFRKWLRAEIARMWTVIGGISDDIKEVRQEIGALQGRIGIPESS